MSANGKTISNLLEDALDLIGKEGSDSSKNQVSASQQLLAERSKLKRTINEEDFIAFDSQKKKVKENPFLDQISGSVVDGPKYWNSGSSGSGTTSLAIKKIKFQGGRTNQNKATKQRQAKGVDYKDKFSAKLQHKELRSTLKKQLKQ
jgi:ABC-type molybdenum transport system ATPase subunit/photorepair protein PhrA